MFNIKQKIVDGWKWIQSKAKWILGIGAIGVVMAVEEIITPILTENAVISEINAQQATFMAEKQYHHIPRYFDDRLNAYIQVNEYLKPDGQRGYWIVIEDNDKVKSVGYGVDAQEYTSEYLKEKPKIVNATSA